ncbi:outer membrane beta-barrel protein [Acidocella aminolytica]|uniref:Porin n=1 Tax=Acidocella aminolytica 101 = DSM 11237 TaxID=1120923 RepID=A0A0D6PG19_9PROT|nr:outer membrane beta-barrel protein [Acidocella aminolytica]GAN80331.1 hypothetical protein Aam_045_005 [Acidocella aminolytica 101 = DSM 11237]GBQ42995.1 hypothetical protein AA11237_3138 [Acidocella aminolytica 101 = DSM 11237]SHE30071.1 Putative beta-barrel porin-2, OmpL-like. bbp2 [Acidocella aminolytica 101 = DSM 11237]
MKKMRPGFALAAGGSLLAMHGALAMTPPASIDIDGGPLGQLEFSGGADGYFYAQSGTSGRGEAGNSAVGDKTTGANLGNALFKLQKTTGTLQFTLEIGPQGGAPFLGVVPAKGSITVYRASPIYLGYITISPPGSPVTLSVGQLNSLEGYESGEDWNNPNLFTSALLYVENGQNVGVSATYTHGPLAATVQFGDGWDTRVFNFLQALVSYSFDSNNVLSLYYGGELGRTGLNAQTYNQSTVAGYGAYLVNSQTFGAYYIYTNGNLNLIPEVQYVYAKPDQAIGIEKYTSTFGAAVFGDYTFGSSPYSLGGMAEYFTSTGAGHWFIAPHAEGFGLSLTPTWQYKDLFVRASVGYMHLLNKGTFSPDDGNVAWGTDGRSANLFQSGLEAGITF